MGHLGFLMILSLIIGLKLFNLLTMIIILVQSFLNQLALSLKMSLYMYFLDLVLSIEVALLNTSILLIDLLCNIVYLFITRFL